MEPGLVLQIIMVMAGAFLLAVTIISLARRKMTEPFCLTWGFISIIIILAGFLLRPAGWNRYVSYTGLILLILIGFCLVYGAYFMSSKISELMRKNNELAIQVSLLKQQQKEMEKNLKELSEKTK